MATIITRDMKDTASSWEACMKHSYCKWPVIAGIAIGGILIVPIIWGCARLICCRRSPKRIPQGNQFSKQSSETQPRASQGYEPTPPPLYDDPNLVPSNSVKSATLKDDPLPPTPSWDEDTQRKGPNGGRNEDVEMGPLEPAQVQNQQMMAHRAPSPMTRLSSIDTRVPHDAVHRPHQSLHASHESQDSQNPFRDQPPEEYPPHRYSPPMPPQSHSPYSHQRSYSPYSPQRPYSPYSPYANGTPKYESAMLAENQQTYKAYSPSIGTLKSTSPHHEPVELASPYNKRPQSLAFERDSQLLLLESQRKSGAWLKSDHNSKTATSSPPLEGNEKPDPSQLPQSTVPQAPSSAPPATERMSQIPGRAL